MGYAERSPNPKVIGKYRVKDPRKMVQLGLVLDSYKIPLIADLWTVSEKEAVARMPLLDLSTLFHQSDQMEGAVTYSFRYYTPPENREEIL